MSFIQPSSRPTQRQYAAIGRVAATWSVLEFLIERTLARLALAPSMLGYVLTDKLGPDNRISAIRSLITVHRVKYANHVVLESELSEIYNLVKVVLKMKADRNHVVHSMWTNTNSTHMSSLNLSDAARSGQGTSVGTPDLVEDIERFADSVQNVCDALWEVSNRIQPPSPQTLALIGAQERSPTNPLARSPRVHSRRAYTNYPSTP